jgi:hypothetical protein
MDSGLGAGGAPRYNANAAGAFSKNDDVGPGAGLPLTTALHMVDDARLSYALSEGLRPP